MTKIGELKEAVARLEVDLAALLDAVAGLSTWQDLDQNRRDGSGAQDARHDEIGRNAEERVRAAQHQVEQHKVRIVALLNAI